ncbi:hypothetical protein BCR44DRAFT_35444 [Catenaria anguillulae PL171]|uniref:Transmembrane protein n=1 Tax=Catenaria anguillulae PL171 TaxID=765915 RepID=A0A1Y2HPC5_9FUNG|nr:hypothetical protein BCR44DRAFT_35444 [Catenaria anguillulae PL171]
MPQEINPPQQLKQGNASTWASRRLVLTLSVVSVVIAAVGIFLSSQVRQHIAAARALSTWPIDMDRAPNMSSMTFRTLPSGTDQNALAQLVESLRFLTWAYAVQVFVGMTSLVALIRNHFGLYMVFGGAGSAVCFLFVGFLTVWVGGGWFNVVALVVAVLSGIPMYAHLLAWKTRLLGAAPGSYANTGDTWVFCL